MLRIVIALALVVGGTVVLTAGGAPIAAEVADADAGIDTAPELIALAPTPPGDAPAPTAARAPDSISRTPTDPAHARVFRPPRV